MARFTNASDMLATGLSQLGVAWRQYTHDEEERKEKIAKAVAPQVFTSMTEEQKEGLTTRQILLICLRCIRHKLLCSAYRATHLCVIVCHL